MWWDSCFEQGSSESYQGESRKEASCSAFHGTWSKKIPNGRREARLCRVPSATDPGYYRDPRFPLLPISSWSTSSRTESRPVHHPWSQVSVDGYSLQPIAKRNVGIGTASPQGNLSTEESDRQAQGTISAKIRAPKCNHFSRIKKVATFEPASNVCAHALVSRLAGSLLIHRTTRLCVHEANAKRCTSHRRFQ